MSGLKSRRKGHNFERWVANEFKDLYPNARRGYQYRDGTDAPDVLGVGGYFIECKRAKIINIQEAYKQAVEASKKYSGWENTPIVISKRDTEDVLVTLPLQTFKALLVKLRTNE